MTPDALVSELRGLLEAHSAIGDGQHAARFASIHKIGNWVVSNDAIARLTRENEKLAEQLRPGSPTERAPTQDAYESACLALHKHRARAETAEAALSAARAELAESHEIIAAVQLLIGMRQQWVSNEQAAVDRNAAWWLLNRITKVQSSPEPEHVTKAYPPSALKEAPHE